MAASETRLNEPRENAGFLTLKRQEISSLLAFAMKGPLVGDYHEIYDENQKWSGNPNSTLVHLLKDHQPGRILDIGAGEGADAAWLAAGGWDVTAVEPSSIACARMRQVFDGTIITSTFEEADLTGTFDVISAFYSPLLGDEKTKAKILRHLAPAGMLLVVHHKDVSRMAENLGRREDEFLLPQLIDWDELTTIQRMEISRHVTHGHGAGHHTDVLYHGRYA